MSKLTLNFCRKAWPIATPSGNRTSCPFATFNSAVVVSVLLCC